VRERARIAGTRTDERARARGGDLGGADKAAVHGRSIAPKPSPGITVALRTKKRRPRRLRPPLS